jgi:hypothetical protein
MRIDVTGNVGIGTTTPVAKLQLSGDFALEKMASGGPRPLPGGATLVWNDGTWLRLNQNLDYSKPILGVHTPGVLAPMSLNVGGVNSWGDPGGGNVWVAGNATINGTLTSGGFVANGVTSINGAFTISGATTLNGAFALNGACSLNGAVTVTGDFTVVSGYTKSFVAPHPTSPEQVVAHVCLEGPEAAVFYRGTAQLRKGRATIRLPEYFSALTVPASCTVQLTPVYEDDEPVVALAASAVEQGRFQVRAISADNPSQRFHWEVKATRADLADFAAEQPMTPELQRAMAARRSRGR